MHYSRTNDPEQKLRLIETAGKLILSDIKQIIPDKTLYSSYNDIASKEKNLEYIPHSLRLLMKQIFPEGPKTASIGQSIMQAARPRTLIVPLHIGLGIQMHHHFGSRFLVHSLNHHGFCSSYTEVQKYERSASVHQGTEICGYTPGHFMQFVAGNVDHNTCTIDGKGTFHGMGIIATITPGIKACKPVPRVYVTKDKIINAGRIPIHAWNSKEDRFSQWTFKHIKYWQIESPNFHIDLLWKASVLFRNPRPSWSGMMQAVHQSNHPGPSSVQFLPMIDMSSSDLTCIYSTLKFICDQAQRYRVSSIVTFDQPLWWKAFMIIANEPESSDMHSIVLRLGGLHIMMSFLGCIGHLMMQSGIQELLSTIYADNAVVHMMTGKAIARAIRSHILVDAALNVKLGARAFGEVSQADSDQLGNYLPVDPLDALPAEQLPDYDQLGNDFLVERDPLDAMPAEPLSDCDQLGNDLLVERDPFDAMPAEQLPDYDQLGNDFLVERDPLDAMPAEPLSDCDQLGNDLLVERDPLDTMPAEPLSDCDQLGNDLLVERDPLDAMPAEPLSDCDQLGKYLLVERDPLDAMPAEHNV